MASPPNPPSTGGVREGPKIGLSSLCFTLTSEARPSPLWGERGERLLTPSTMKKIAILAMLCAAITVQAQTIQAGHRFWDGVSLYTVQEVRMGNIIYMTTSQDNELTLQKETGRQGEYTIIPSRQADDCPFGAEWGWRVRHVTKDGEDFLAVLKPNGDAMWVMAKTKRTEAQCEQMQAMMGQEEPWNAVNGVLLNRAYLQSHVATRDELRLLRNKILAYHGYRFQSKDLQEHFGKMAWYRPVDDNNAIKLNIIEQTNIQLIKSEEAERAEAEAMGDEPYWETEEGVTECIMEYFEAVNKTFAEGSDMNPFDLDKKYYSAYWNEVYDEVNNKESLAPSAEQRFFVDDKHWTAGMETPLEARDIKIEFLADEKAEAQLTLVDKAHGHRQKVILTLDFEQGIWRISNWLQKSHDTAGSLLRRMEKYIGL